MDIIEHGAADQLSRPIAEHALDRWALVEDAAGGIDDRDGIRAPFDERPEALLAGPQRTLGVVSLGAVVLQLIRDVDRHEVRDVDPCQQMDTHVATCTVAYEPTG